MKEKIKIFLFYISMIVVLSAPAFQVWAQDGSAGGSVPEPAVVTPPAEVATTSSATPKPVAPASQVELGTTSASGATVPRPPTPQPAPASQDSFVPSNTVSESAPIITATPTPVQTLNSNAFALVGVAVAILVAGGIGAYKLKTRAALVSQNLNGRAKNQNKKDDKKDKSGCLNLKKLMEQKLGELTDLKGQLQGRAGDKAKEEIKGLIGGTVTGDILIKIESAKAEYERLKKLYEQCTIEFGGKKRAIIVHGSPEKEEYFDQSKPTPSNSNWFPWVRGQLLLKGIVPVTPEMPDAYEPNYEKWKKTFEKSEINEDTTLVGHSCGGGFLVRWLSENDIKVGKVVLVAPWLDPEHLIDKKFFEFDIDENLVSRTQGLVVMYSTDDDSDVLKTVQILKSKLKGAELQEFNGKGHFVTDDMKTEEFPELLQNLISK
jgi:hypothetical protein